MCFFLQFNQTVRVRSISIFTRERNRGPKTVKLFINKPSIGFEDAEGAEEPQAAQVFELNGDEVSKEGNRIGLRYVRFQTVNSLHASHLFLSFRAPFLRGKDDVDGANMKFHNYDL
jgi:hypothetical protein